MGKFKIKSSVSRKPLHKLSVKQRSRVMLEVRMHLKSQNIAASNPKCSSSNDCNDVQNVNDSAIPGCSSSIKCNLQNISDSAILGHSSTNDNPIPSYNCDIMYDENFINDESSSSSCSDINDISVLSDNEPTYRERLASCFVNNNFTHVQGNSMLSLLRTHPCFSNLPKDVRTLVSTPRNNVVSKVEPGEYIYFDLEASLIEYVSNFSLATTLSEIVLDFQIDWCALDRAGTIHLWPIQCRIINIEQAQPIIVGIYKGLEKPRDPNSFFQAFIKDIQIIIDNGGINFNGNRIPIQLRCFIADAPARAFILNHRGHMSSKPCSKCKVSGTICEGRNVFNGINHSLRTDEEYFSVLDEDHH
ncbi:uncharacterized protein LOC116853466, partial [Odontomachus brunneus]|uniref:uncharacterized protein LOC116853466 n=1 Tax=Odontomachus brunneus TaxID=486640 RepID=UPI0013F1B4BD